jgi:drug/metabolite transporter (DMT)-like permease
VAQATDATLEQTGAIMSWFLLAVLASLLWGVCYSIDERLFKEISVPTALAINHLFAGILFGIWTWHDGSMRTTIQTVTSSAWAAKLLISAVLINTTAGFFICRSIADKNASLASLIEISYPIFTVLFSYLLFRENNLTWATAMGGMLIFAGIYLIHQFGG